MGHIESPPRIGQKGKRPAGPGKLLVEYVSIAGSIFLLVNAVKSMNWTEAVIILTNPTGQAVLVSFGAASVFLLWLVEHFRR